MRVLIAEDEAIIRMDLVEMLTEEGHDVVGDVGDGASAVKEARHLEPDLAILDIKMPVMDGLKAAKVMNDEGLCAVLILTAFSQKTYVDEAVKAGAIGYLVKPFEKKDLGPAIEIAVARHKQLMALAEEAADAKERLQARKLVEKVKGLLMQQGMSEPDAFRLIQKTAMDKQLTLKAAAEAVLKERSSKGR